MILDTGYTLVEDQIPADSLSDMARTYGSGMVNEMAISMAREISDRWPFTVRRIRVSLFGLLSQPGSRHVTGTALVLGLSGIEAADLQHPDRRQAFRLRDRLMAVRLSGRRLVAFHPDRDVEYKRDHVGLWPDRVRLDAFPFAAGPVRSVERVARPNVLGFYRVPPAG